MARIRTIKPEFWPDEKLAPLPALTRLVFLGLVSLADDAGRLVDNVKTIDGALFSETEESSHEPIETLARLGRVLRYRSASGQRLLQITNWSKHQKVDNPSKVVLPAPTGQDVAAAAVAELSREPSEDDARVSRSDLGPRTSTKDLGPSTSPNGEVSAAAPSESESAKPNGKGKALARVAPMNLVQVEQRLLDTQVAVQRRIAEGKQAFEHAEQLIRYKTGVAFAYWQRVCDHPRAGLDADSAKLLRQHLKWTSGSEDPVGDLSYLLYVIDGSRHSEWHQGTEGKGANVAKRNWIPQLFGKRQLAQQLAEKCADYRAGTPHPIATEMLAAVSPPNAVEVVE